MNWPVVGVELTNGADLAAELRESVRSSSSEGVVKRLQQRRLSGLQDAFGLLVLDDIEVFKGGDWLVEALYRIIDFRYRENLPTAVASNLSLEELRSQLGDRIVRRLTDMTEPVIIEGANDYRGDTSGFQTRAP